ncbi:hypothetical protein BC834DRAFT_46363 [Gloeopeniophorella convolvens]|nr:hypothetical protein BC834DRAFT_46363 [Gloeopeniophorella convolvens]
MQWSRAASETMLHWRFSKQDCAWSAPGSGQEIKIPAKRQSAGGSTPDGTNFPHPPRPSCTCAHHLVFFRPSLLSPRHPHQMRRGNASTPTSSHDRKHSIFPTQAHITPFHPSIHQSLPLGRARARPSAQQPTYQRTAPRDGHIVEARARHAPRAQRLVAGVAATRGAGIKLPGHLYSPRICCVRYQHPALRAGSGHARRRKLPERRAQPFPQVTIYCGPFEGSTPARVSRSSGQQTGTGTGDCREGTEKSRSTARSVHFAARLW